MEAHAEHVHHHRHDEVEVNPAEWTDGKRYAWLLGIIVPLGPLWSGIYWYLTGFEGFWFLGPVLLFVIFPLLDIAIGTDSVNPPDSVLKFLEEDRYYRWCTYLFIPIQYAGLVFACWMWSSGEIGPVGSVGLAMTMGAVGGIAINTAHELGHKRANSEKWLSRIALAQTGYGHFFIEHNRGHHVKVATPEDPASSRLGESFWAFLPRTVIGSLHSAWEIETTRLDRLGERRIGRHNDILTAWAMTVGLFAVLTISFGLVVLPYLVAQAAIGFSLLEVVNYLEHYGLCRQRNQDGRYEKVGPRHSWNSDRVVTNVFLFQLQRHSDHHGNSLLRYQALRSLDESPQLPAGYASMIVLALVPPLWRRVMDKRVVAHYGGDLSLANVHHRAAASESSARGPR